MAGARLVIAATRGGQAGGVTLLNGTASTGYALVDDIDWGNYDPELVYSVRKDGSSTATDFNLPPREPKIPLKAIGTSQAAALVSINTLGREVLACWRNGGKLTYQANLATYPIYLKVRGAGYNPGPIVSNRFEIHWTATGQLDLVTDPAAYGDEMSFRDEFSIDSSTSWSRTDTGGAVTIAAGRRVFAGNGLKLGRHTGRGYSYTDVQVTERINTGASVTSGDWSVSARCQGPTSATDTALICRIIAGTNQVQFAKVVAGAVTTLATAAFTPAVSTSYWIRLRMEGAVGTAEVFTSEPKPLDAATATASATLSAADQQAFVSGGCGDRLNVVAFATESSDDFDVRSYTYRFSSPDVLRLCGIPGDMPAAICAEVSVPAALATQAVFGDISWAERQRQVNYCWNGNLEQTITGNTTGWFNTVVAGVINAALGSGPTRNAAAAKFGSACVEFLTTAAASQGLNFPMPRRFKKGQTYVVSGWMSSAAGTGLASLRIGANGDVADSTQVALSTAWKLYTAVWTPTADRDIAYVAPIHVAATAETQRVDGVGVFAVTPQTQNGGITNVATSMPLTAIPPEGNPTLPCVFVLEPGTANQELVRATAVDATGLIFTIDRGWDGSTAAAHATATAAYALPSYWFDANSDGVHGSMLDIIGVASPYNKTADLTAMSADATQRSGFKLLSSGAAASSLFSILVDPYTMVPPDFSGDELLVEVWLRDLMTAGAPSPRLTAYSRGEDGVGAAIRYGLENGSGGLAVLSPTGSARRYARVDVLPIRFSEAQQRKRVQMVVQYDISSVGTQVSFDYLKTGPNGQRATSPTGRLDDANYPDFLPTVSAQQTRRIFSDFASEAGLARETMAPGNMNPQGGVIGVETALAFGAPNTDVLVKLSNLVPNGGLAGDADESLSIASDATITASFNPTPRFLTLR